MRAAVVPRVATTAAVDTIVRRYRIHSGGVDSDTPKAGDGRQRADELVLEQ
jgi:hypothetical protein